MISSNTLYVYLIQHNQNEVCDQNIRSVQEAMCFDKPDGSKFKHVCTYFPILAVLAKSAMPGDIQVTYAHASVGKNILGKRSLLLL